MLVYPCCHLVNGTDKQTDNIALCSILSFSGSGITSVFHLVCVCACECIYRCACVAGVCLKRTNSSSRLCCASKWWKSVRLFYRMTGTTFCAEPPAPRSIYRPSLMYPGSSRGSGWKRVGWIQFCRRSRASRRTWSPRLAGSRSETTMWWVGSGVIFTFARWRLRFFQLKISLLPFISVY